MGAGDPDDVALLDLYRLGERPDGLVVEVVDRDVQQRDSLGSTRIELDLYRSTEKVHVPGHRVDGGRAFRGLVTVLRRPGHRRSVAAPVYQAVFGVADVLTE